MRKWLAFPAVALAALSAVAAAQTGDAPQWLNSTATINVPFPSATSRVVDAPYSGEFVLEALTVGPDGTKRPQFEPQRRKSFRDSQGRTRDESTKRMYAVQGRLAKESATIVYIDDVVGGFRYVLDTQRQVAHRMKLTRPTSSISPVAGGSAQRRPDPREERMGTRVIAGELAEGIRVASNGLEIDTWTIPDLNVVAARETRLAAANESSDRLVSLRRGEPGPALFEVPQGYTLVDETKTFLVDLAPLP